MQKFLIFVVVLILFLSCGTYRAVPVSDLVPISHANEIKELSASLEKVVNAGGNHYRKKAIVSQLEEFGLKEHTVSERIDWLSLQKNVVVNIQGKSDSLIYVVAHYDKTDINPLKLVSVFLNGLLDPLISWSYTSQGAIDNATGVSVALQLSKSLSKKENHYSYRILFSGSEESGLRGARAHVARLKPEEFNLIKFVINIDVVGVKDKPNCVYMLSDDDLEKEALKIAEQAHLELGLGSMPAGASSDYLPFKSMSLGLDFARSFAYNLTGSFLPQRSYFTQKKSTKVVNFSSCGFLDVGDTVGGFTLLPLGAIHGFRDNIKKVDPIKLLEMYQLLKFFIQENEKRAGA